MTKGADLAGFSAACRGLDHLRLGNLRAAAHSIARRVVCFLCREDARCSVSRRSKNLQHRAVCIDADGAST
jgi:hypothetical protein